MLFSAVYQEMEDDGLRVTFSPLILEKSTKSVETPEKNESSKNVQPSVSGNTRSKR